MLTVTNAKLASMIYGCERLIETGTERLEKRKLIKRGLSEVNKGIGGLDVLREVLTGSIDAKSVSLIYNQEAK